MTENKTLNGLETLLLGLADKTRLRLLNLMRENEVCVYLFTEILGESQPKISRHLAYLRNTGIVESRREGKLIYYRIANADDKFVEDIISSVLRCLESQAQLQTEYNNLISKISNPVNVTKNSKVSSDVSKGDTYANTNISAKEPELEIFLL